MRSGRTAVGVTVACFACAVYALSAFGGSTGSAAFGGQYGNSPNAKLCQQGGWQKVLRSDGTRFVSEADCVAYGAMGGTVTVNQSLRDCELFGGTYSTDPSTNQFAGGTLLWTCLSYETFTTGPPPQPPSVLANDCFNTAPFGSRFGPIIDLSLPRQTSSCVK